MAQSSITTPSASTGLGPSRTRATEVRWVFPERITMPLAGVTVVGRDEGCETVLLGSEISRRHAELRIDGPLVAVRDLGSRNGVYVNGRRVQDAPLMPGDVVRCGEWIGVLINAREGAAPFGEIMPGWYGSAVLADAVEPARRLRADLPVIVQGETGTGKEGTARAIHAWAGRRGPFIAVNCAALPADLAEAELFGYRKGAFTGADQTSPGLFRAADGGSIFLDEILELPLALQPKLLRVLEERRVRALGETRDVAIDVRVIAATQESLADAVAAKRFRADLHARLDGLTVVLPPLRERREDILPLFVELLRQHGGGRPPAIEAKLAEAVVLYDWPLNVRELVLLARRLLALHAHEPSLKKIHLPERILARAPTGADGPGPAQSSSALSPPTGTPAAGIARRARRATDDDTEFDALIEALREADGSVAKAAAIVGVSRARAYRLIAAHPDFSLEEVR
jgi:transcriptional regulator with PAS, ATPase and Fis domain